jgi:biopolymer transport protein ExbD
VRQNLFQTKGLIAVVFVVALFIFVAFALITLTQKSNLPKETPKENAAIDSCAPFIANKETVSCGDAVKKASADTKGKITKITIGTIALSDVVKKAIGDQKEMWLIDVDLEKPIVTLRGKEIKSLRVGIPTDGTNGIFKTPIQP